MKLNILVILFVMSFIIIGLMTVVGCIVAIDDKGYGALLGLSLMAVLTFSLTGLIAGSDNE